MRRRLFLLLLFFLVASLWLFSSRMNTQITADSATLLKSATNRRAALMSADSSQVHLVGGDPTDPASKDALSAWFPYTDKRRADGWPHWEAENHKALKSLLACTLQENCKPNQDKVVILASYHFRGGLVGWVGGEDIWAQSVMTALKKLGYTYLFAFENDHVVRLHQMFPSLVIAIFMENDKQEDCWKDEFNCIKSEHNPYGVPIWKILTFHYWIQAQGPLGANWTLNPEPYGMEGHDPNVFLGYSIEPFCASHPLIPHFERHERAYIMAKRLQYLVESENRAWPPEFFTAASAELGIDIVIGASGDDLVGQSGRALRPEDVLPKGVTNLGKLGLSAFIEELSRSQVLIGVGLPWTSPTPYQALCLGVPFINPIMKWDKAHPEDRYKWSVQHGILKFWDPPYVYNVFKDDKKGFIDAIRSALDNPIDSFIVEHMQMKALENRIEAILSRNHYSMAKGILERRMARLEHGPWFTL